MKQSTMPWQPPLPPGKPPPLPPGKPPPHTKIYEDPFEKLFSTNNKTCEWLCSTDTSPCLIQAFTTQTSAENKSQQEIGRFVKGVAIAHGLSLPSSMRIIFRPTFTTEGTLSTDVCVCPVTNYSLMEECFLHMRIECNGFCTKIGLVSHMGEDGFITDMKLWTESYFEQISLML